METVYASFDDDGIGRVLIELAKAYTPRDTIREYLTNGLDARLQGQREQISVLLDPRDRRIIISDNGIGIHPNILRAMQESSEIP
jgi:DNA gyrase/topoisomerase IV subunit B